MTLIPKSKFLTVKQVAEIFAVTPRSIYRWKESGVLPFIKVGGRVRFSTNDLEARLSIIRSELHKLQPLTVGIEHAAHDEKGIPRKG